MKSTITIAKGDGYNKDDLYAGIEYLQTDVVIDCLKLISRSGCEKIIRYATVYAKQNGRKTGCH